MTATPPYILAAWKLKERVKHQRQEREAAPATVANLAATTRLADTMAGLGFPSSIWERRSWMVGEKQHSRFVRNYPDSDRRAHVWRLMREPRAGVVLSFPEIARACGMPTHSTIIGAVRRLKSNPVTA
jgi:hypothetical protein